MFDRQLYEKIIIEGNSPERALTRLQRSGICLYKVKKCKKNQILAIVTKKDSEKVFAIYPNMCYNREDKKAYTVKIAGKVGIYKRAERFVKRWGAVLGAAAFLFLCSAAEFFVFSIRVTGETSYAREVTEILSLHGVKKYKAYPKGKEEIIASALLSLNGVSFASVQKSGVTVSVEIRTSSFLTPNQKTGDMTAEHTGVLLSATVLRGTLIKQIGQVVQSGEIVVGGYVLTGENTKIRVAPSAKIRLLCKVEEFFVAQTQDEAFAKALLLVDGQIKTKRAVPCENGFAVEISYEVTESVNF